MRVVWSELVFKRLGCLKKKNYFLTRVTCRLFLVNFEKIKNFFLFKVLFVKKSKKLFFKVLGCLKPFLAKNLKTCLLFVD